MRARYTRESLTRIRKQIVDAVNEPEAARYLADHVNVLAKAEGYVLATETIDHWLDWRDPEQEPGSKEQEFRSKAAAIAAAFDLLTQGADDSWSGRSNDARRAYFDGVRAAISDRRWGDLNPEKAGPDSWPLPSDAGGE